MYDTKDLKPQEIVALKEGRGIRWEGGIATAKDFGLPEGSAPESVGLAYELTQANLRIAELEAQLGGVSSDDVALHEQFLPTSKTAIAALSLDRLKALATIRGVSVEGDEKDAYVVALSPAE